MVSEGICVNMKNKMFLVSGIGLDVLNNSGMYPCAVCHSGVGNNSKSCALSVSCGSTRGAAASLFDCWSTQIMPALGVEARLSPSVADQRLNWMSTAPWLMWRPLSAIWVMLCPSGDCDSAIATRCCMAWRNFRKLLPVLTTRHLLHSVRQGVHSLCPLGYNAPW